MHEMSVLEALLGEVRARVPPGARLAQVVLEVGSLEHLDPEILQTGWQALTLKTELAGSRLEICTVPVRARCKACGQKYEPDDTTVLICPACQHALPEIIQGTGIVLRSLEVVVDEAPNDATSQSQPTGQPQADKRPDR